MRKFFNRSRQIIKIGITPPKPNPNRNGIAIVLIVKNEGRHIGEWAKFHYKAGVRHFYVYDDGSEDNTLDVLSSVLPNDTLTVTPWCQRLKAARTKADIHNQVLAYAHAIRNYGSNYRWMTFIDVDEFIVPTQKNSIADALSHLEEAKCISLPWHNFGRNGHNIAPEGGIINNYTKRVANPMSSVKGIRNFKCIVDPCHVTAANVHQFEIDGDFITCNDQGDEFTVKTRKSSDFYSTAHLQLNHYYSRSTQDLHEKIALGNILPFNQTKHTKRVMRNVKNIEKDEIDDFAAIEFLQRIQ